MPTDKVKVIEFIAPERFSGKSKYNFFKSFSLATDSIIQFSVRPLRLATYIGVVRGIDFTGDGCVCYY